MKKLKVPEVLSIVMNLFFVIYITFSNVFVSTYEPIDEKKISHIPKEYREVLIFDDQLLKNEDLAKKFYKKLFYIIALGNLFTSLVILGKARAKERHNLVP